MFIFRKNASPWRCFFAKSTTLWCVWHPQVTQKIMYLLRKYRSLVQHCRVTPGIIVHVMFQWTVGEPVRPSLPGEAVVPGPVEEVPQPRAERSARYGSEPYHHHPPYARAHPGRSGREESHPHPQCMGLLCKYSRYSTHFKGPLSNRWILMLRIWKHCVIKVDVALQEMILRILSSSVSVPRM